MEISNFLLRRRLIMFGFLNKKGIIEINSPVKGKAINIASIPDQVFSSGMLGVGIGFDPSEGIIYSPCDGEIVQLFPTKHAVGILSAQGVEILIHIGVDTVNLKGEGFASFVNVGDFIKKGDKLIAFNMETIKEKAKSILTSMIITNMDIVNNVEPIYGECGINTVVFKIKLK
jgi:sugar PTS system EIIA component